MEAEATDGIPLIDGEWLTLHSGMLTITSRTGDLVRQVPLNDVTGVRRGGRDLVVTRRERDPVVVTAATLADAQQFIELLGQYQPPPQRPTWWRRRARQ